MLYNIDIEIGHPVVSITRAREMYSESLDQFLYITPSPMPVASESALPYWTERREEITDEHLVTLGKHQQQFLGSLNPKGEVEPKAGEKASVNEVKGERVPKTQGSKDPEKNDREELIRSLIRSNGHLVADIASLKRSLKEIVDELHFNNKEKKYDNKYDIDRQVQLAIHLKEKQLEELKERSRQELLEQQKQRDEFQQKRLDTEKAMQASLEGEKRKLERIRKENLVELERQGVFQKLKEKQQQEIDLQVAKQLQLNENARAMKQNQAVKIDRLVKVIDERNGDLGKNARLGKETKNPDSGGSHIVDREVRSGSKPSGDAVRPWLTPPSPPPSPLSSPPPPPLKPRRKT